MFNNRFRDGVSELSSYSAGLSSEKVKKIYDLDRVVKLASNENGYGAAVDLNGLNEVDLVRYPDLGNSGLVGAISELYGVDQARIVVGNGSDELIFLLGQLFLNDGDEVLSSEATFSYYAIVAGLMKAEFVQVPLRDDLVDLDGILGRVSERTKLVFIANPNSPTGTYVGDMAFDRFMSTLDSKVIVVLDEAYYEYVLAEDYPDSVSLMGKYDNLVVLRTFSKIYGLASLRVGYGFASPEIVDYLYRLRPPFSVNSLALKAGELAIGNQGFVRECRTRNLAGKQRVYDLFESLGIRYLPSEGNFVYFEVAEAQQVFETLLENGVVVRHLASFGRAGALRVSIGSEEEMGIFETTFKEVI